MFCNLLSMISASKEIGRRLEICSKNSSLDPRFTSCFMISDKVGLQIVIFWFVFSEVLYSSWTLHDFFPAPLLFHMLDTFCLLISCHSILKYRINEDIKYILNTCTSSLLSHERVHGIVAIFRTYPSPRDEEFHIKIWD